MTNPSTVPEWLQYVAAIPQEEFWAQALGANTLAFVSSLQADGYSAEEIRTILLAFAAHFAQVDLAPPGYAAGQYLSYPDLIESMNTSEFP